MFVARIKFNVQPVNSYKIGDVYTLYEKNNLKCVYRYNEDDSFEFVLGNFVNQNDAFEKGKQLYIALLYLLNIEQYPFDLKVIDFEEQKSHLTQRMKSLEPNQFYFSNHDYFNNYNGLEIFEIEKDFFNEYDRDQNFQQSIYADITFSTNHKYKFEHLKDLNISFCEESIRILKLYELYRHAHDLSIQAMIISIIFETMANMEIRELINKCERSQNFDEKDKTFFEELVSFEKENSVIKKCNLLIQKYSQSYNSDKKVFSDCYKLRSKVSHGEQINDESKTFATIQKSLGLSLKIFKNKFSK